LLTSLEWRLEEAPYVPVKDVYGAIVDTGNVLRRVVLGNGFLGPLLKDQTQIELIIQGEAYSPGSYREAQEQVDVMVQALQKTEGVSVYASQMPTDVRTDIDMTLRVDDGEVRAPFTLEVTFANKPADNQDLAGGTP